MKADDRVLKGRFFCSQGAGRPGSKSIFSLSLLSFPFVISCILLTRAYSGSTTETGKSATRGVWLLAWTEGCIILS